MPQISKIRIVNFNYNDGNRFIPDELYDLASPDTGKALNTLFNLNNGGGKTVLVQLMMQPVHPKAMAGGRRIEDYFSHTGDHSYILLEWNLDGSKEKLLTGISIAASSSASTEEDKRGNSVDPKLRSRKICGVLLGSAYSYELYAIHIRNRKQRGQERSYPG